MLVERVQDYAIFMLDPEGRVFTWNRGAQRIKGYRAEEIIGKHFSVFYTEEDLERGHPEEVLRLAASKGSYEEEGLRVRKDGSRFWANVVITALRDEDGPLRGFSKVVRDVTERKEADESLRRSEERYRAVVEQSTEGIYLFDARTRHLVETNPSFQRMLGYAAEELVGMKLHDLLAHPREEVEYNVVRTLEEGHRYVGERRYRRKDGTLVDVEAGASVIRYGDGEVVCAVLRDITERKEAERRLGEVREAERNRIARDLHDDILQDIVYALQEIQIIQITSEHGGDAALEDAAEALRRSVEGLRGAIFELRVGALSWSFLSSLEALLDLNRRMSRNRYELRLTLEDGFPPEISERAGRQLTRIVQEALTNARRHAEARRVEVRLWREGETALVEVSDDGRGFDAGSSGAGVGRQSMGQRASEIGGELELESAPGEGTRVRIRVPVSRLVAAGEAAAPNTEGVPDGVQKLDPFG